MVLLAREVYTRLVLFGAMEICNGMPVTWNQLMVGLGPMQASEVSQNSMA